MNSNAQGIDRDKRILDYEYIVSYDDMEMCLGILADRYRNMRITPLGTTVLGRSIPVISLGNGKKEVVYIGCIHGFNYSICSIMLRYINEYCELRKNQRRIYNLNLQSMEETRTIHIIPMLNPDGVSYVLDGIAENNPIRQRLIGMNGGRSDFTRWGANARGVDLNRNFGYDYAEQKRREELRGGAPLGYSGMNPESEPESGAFCNYVRYKEETRLVLNFTSGRDAVSYIEDESIPRSKSIGQSLARISGKPLTRCGTEEIRGSLVGWCGRIMGIPSYNIYCGGDSGDTAASNGCFKQYAGVRELLFTAPVLI